MKTIPVLANGKIHASTDHYTLTRLCGQVSHPVCRARLRDAASCPICPECFASEDEAIGMLRDYEAELSKPRPVVDYNLKKYAPEGVM